MRRAEPVSAGREDSEGAVCLLGRRRWERVHIGEEADISLSLYEVLRLPRRTRLPWLGVLLPLEPVLPLSLAQRGLPAQAQRAGGRGAPLHHGSLPQSGPGAAAS